ncbi:amino-acid N-acetyltransferase [Myceligenerans sp. TRM 65318]|uniref:Amino-acid N-acetyltransferase n=1 Tax=Myceligenerans pegani TaxID=2776917 RepID=A0ABR9N4U6_9MICO|nr:amino-acid N-acetyltransferase [Myceligenerans sp. TRM 65318]MBE3020946.1 amino-acid N-acetyltransferase [Myceligenerans sp. TRM 65318]
MRPARPADVRAIRALVEPYAQQRILLAKEWVGYYEAVQEFLVAEVSMDDDGPGRAGSAGAVSGVESPERTAAPAPGPAVSGTASPERTATSAPGYATTAVVGPEKTGTSAATAVVGCGALHVMWEDLAEIRTLAVDPGSRGRRVGHELVEGLLDRARGLGLRRVFCLTFEVEFFRKHGFEEIDSTPVSPEVYAELLRSHDDGVAEFLDLARVKPNTLGNSRMLLEL